MAAPPDDVDADAHGGGADGEGPTGAGSAARWGRAAGVAGGLAGVAASLFVLFGPTVRYRSQSSAGEVTTGTLSGVDYLLGEPNAQFALLAWPLLLGTVSAVGARAAWSERAGWTWAAAVTLAAFAVVGMASIGGLYVPAALLLLAGAALSTRRRR